MAEIRNKYLNIENEPCFAFVDYILSGVYFISAVFVGLSLLYQVREKALRKGIVHVDSGYIDDENLFGIDDLKNPFLFLIKLVQIIFVFGVFLVVGFLFFFPIAYFTHFDSRHEILLSVMRWSDEYGGGYIRMSYLIIVLAVLAACSGMLEWIKAKFSAAK